MIKWPITYTDYNGEERTEDFYFNFNKAEVMEMNLRHNGAYKAYLEGIVAARDGEKMAEVVKDFILKAYGQKDPDGRRFVKSAELSESFSQTEAYSDLYMELFTDQNKMIKFIQGVLPKMDGNAPVPSDMKLA